MESLKKILALESLPLSPWRMDLFQRAVEKNLYLEFFLSNTRALLSPNHVIMAVGPASEEETDELQSMLKTQQQRINELKSYVIYHLALYTSILETNAYYIAANEHLLICRFVSLARKDYGEFEIKFYTAKATDLPHNYQDKIYIGRDFISLRNPKRSLFGLLSLRDALQDQRNILSKRAKNILQTEELKSLKDEYIDEILNIALDAHEAITSLGKKYGLSSKSKAQKPMQERILAFQQDCRDLLYIYIDLQDELYVLQEYLFKERQQPVFVRYVTKFIKDVNNHINYINFKLCGRISDSLNDIRMDEREQ